MANGFRLVPGTLVAGATKSEFRDDEDVIVNVRCTVERDGYKPAVWGVQFGLWQGSVQIAPINQISWHNTGGIGSGIDSQNENYNINMGKLQAGSYPLTVVVSARDFGQ